MDPRVLLPSSMPDLLTVLKRRPDCILWAGGTYLGTDALAREDSLKRDIISLQKVDELLRILRTDRFVDIGSMVNLERILRLEDELLPPGLRLAIHANVPSPARNLATLGGNLCIENEITNLLPWMAASDARFELKKQGSTRFIGAARFMDAEKGLDIEPGEVLTRIRIPVERWNHQVYRRIEDKSRKITLSGFASIHQDTVEDLRVCVAFSNKNWFFNPLIDSEILSMRLPLSPRIVRWYEEKTLEAIQEKFPLGDQILKHYCSSLINWFLTKLPSVRE